MLNRPSDFNFAAVVWGGKYAHFFIDYCLQSLVSNCNLSNRRFQNSTLRVYTDAATAPLLKSRLQWFPLDHEVIVADASAFRGHKYRTFQVLNQMALADSFEQGRYTCFLIADAIYSTAFFRAVAIRVDEGAQAVQSRNLRMDRQPYMKWLLNTRFPMVRMDNYIREDCLHPWSKSCFYSASPSSIHCSEVHYPYTVDNGLSKKLVSRCFHMHPHAIKPVRVAELQSNIDVDLVGDTCDHNLISYITDSREAHCVEVSDHDQDANLLCNIPFTSNRIAAWAMQAGCKAIHWQNRNNPITYWL